MQKINMNFYKNFHGISVISLVITISVLLILTGITLSTVTKENGLLKQSKDVSSATDRTSLIELVKTDIHSMQIRNGGKIYKDEFKEILDKYFSYNLEGDELPDDLSSLVLTSNDNKYNDILASEIYDGKFYEDDTLKVKKIKESKKILTENTKVISDDRVKITVPAGFTIPNESPNNAKEGIIITDSIDETGKSNGNEFVWIPINPDLTVVGTNKPMAKISTADEYIGKDDNGKTNYEGVLYNFTGTDSTEMESYGQGTHEYREPDSKIVYDADYPEDAQVNYLRDLRQWLPGEADRYQNYNTFLNTMKEDYNEMIYSVKTYGGFYVARYEMGVKDVIEYNMSSGKATSKIGPVRNAGDWFVSRQWYGLYSKAKTYTNEKKSVKSSMIWGSQYDAMLNYALTGDDKEKVTKNGNGYYGDKEVNTGVTENDKILNIFDLEGNHTEWTLEANSDNYRVARGSYYNNTDKFSPSSRSNVTCDSTLQCHATRFTLYIK